MEHTDDSTVAEKALVCLTSFGFSCAAFMLAAVILVPITGFISQTLSLPDIVPQTLIMLELFALPVAAALWGVNIAARPIIARRTEFRHQS